MHLILLQTLPLLLLTLEAIYRCYDAKRRSWTDLQPSRQAQVEKNKEENCRRAKQIQVTKNAHSSFASIFIIHFQLYKRRAKKLKGKEKEYWDSIVASYMSEDSAHEEEGELVMHKHTPEYCSEGTLYIHV